MTEPTRVALETSTPSLWIAREGRKRGHEVVVADSRELAAVTQDVRRCDEHDAGLLARLGAPRREQAEGDPLA